MTALTLFAEMAATARRLAQNIDVGRARSSAAFEARQWPKPDHHAMGSLKYSIAPAVRFTLINANRYPTPAPDALATFLVAGADLLDRLPDAPFHPPTEQRRFVPGRDD